MPATVRKENRWLVAGLREKATALIAKQQVLSSMNEISAETRRLHPRDRREVLEAPRGHDIEGVPQEGVCRPQPQRCAINGHARNGKRLDFVNAHRWIRQAAHVVYVPWVLKPPDHRLLPRRVGHDGPVETHSPDLRACPRDGGAP